MNIFIKKIVTEFLKPVLKKNGFKKRNLVWSRVRDDLVDIISLYESKGSSSDTAIFRMEIGIVSPRVNKIIWGDETEIIDFASSVFRPKISLFDPKLLATGDSFYQVESDTEALIIGEQVSQILTDEVIPIFGSVNDYSNLAKQSEKYDHEASSYALTDILIGLAYELGGDRKNALRLFDEVEQGWNEVWKEKARDIRNTLNLR